MVSYNLLTDKELTDLLKKGDDKAFDQIFKRYNSLLFIHAFKKMENKEEAKDIVQEVFASLWAKREEIVIKSNLIGYLYTTVRNKIFDVVAHNKVASNYIGSLTSFYNLEYVVADHLIREKQITEMIEQEIGLLPARMKLVFVLSRKEHKTYKEIAILLSLSEETVKDQIKKALKILRVKLNVVGIFLL